MANDTISQGKISQKRLSGYRRLARYSYGGDVRALAQSQTAQPGNSSPSAELLERFSRTSTAEPLPLGEVAWQA